ncbi:hypothetical protein Motto_68 [Pseudomonas phage Motto]|nr:hypothetical protein Motto_68 [Pseudomonas phage Motto]
MQQVKIINSDYITFDPVVCEIVNARRFGNGWMIKVSESFIFCRDNARVWSGDEDQEMYFGSWEVEEVKSPFAYWNKLKSGTLHAEL